MSAISTHYEHYSESKYRNFFTNEQHPMGHCIKKNNNKVLVQDVFIVVRTYLNKKNQNFNWSANKYGHQSHKVVENIEEHNHFSQSKTMDSFD